MRKVRGSMILLLIISMLLFIISCSEESSTEPDNSNPEIYDALEGYWGTNQSINSALKTRDAIIDEIGAILLPDENMKNRDSFDDIMALMDELDIQSQIISERFNDLLDLEDNITAYGTNPRNMFTDAAKAIVVGTYNAAKKTVVSTAQMTRTTFRVFTGQQTLRQALADPDSGIPLISSWAANAREHLALTDQAIYNEILIGDDHEGWIDINSIPGNTNQEKANNYMNMNDEDPVKKSCRRNIHIWDRDNAIRIHTNVTKNTKEGVKHLVGTITSETQVEIMDQMTNQNQDPTPGTVNQQTVDTTTQTNIEKPKTVIIKKHNQPEDQEKIIIIDEAPEDLDIDLPGGIYDFIVIAEDYVRSLSGEMEIAANDLIDETLEMYKYSEFSIIIESIICPTYAPVVNQPVDIEALVISLIGSELDFQWAITGGSYTDLDNNDYGCTFTPTQPGVFTVTMTATDSFGASKSASIQVTVTDIDIRISDFEIITESFIDTKLNPGETVQIRFSVENLSENEITGDIYLEGATGIQVPDNVSYNITLPANGSGYFEYVNTVTLPVDYSAQTAEVALNFNTSYETRLDVNIACPVILDVDFYVQFDAINSPVTDRILNVAGQVANPSLLSAIIVLDGDYDNIFEVNLSNGYFSKEIALSGSGEEEDHYLDLTAQSGGWIETATIEFTAEIPPQGFRVTLSWDTGGTDVDLWTTGPNGEKCYYANQSTGDGLILDFDDTNGYGPENITCATPPEGDYLVQVHYYSDHDNENAISTSCSVVIRLNEGTPDEETINYYGYLGDSGDIWTVTTITLGYDNLYHSKQIDQHSTVLPELLPQK